VVVIAVEAVLCVACPHAASSSAEAVNARRFMRVNCKWAKQISAAIAAKRWPLRRRVEPQCSPPLSSPNEFRPAAFGGIRAAGTPEPPELLGRNRRLGLDAHLVKTQSRNNVSLPQRWSTADTEGMGVDL